MLNYTTTTTIEELTKALNCKTNLETLKDTQVEYSLDKSLAVVSIRVDQNKNTREIHAFKMVGGLYHHEKQLTVEHLKQPPSEKFGISLDVSKDGRIVAIGDTDWGDGAGVVWVFKRVDHPILWLNSSALSSGSKFVNKVKGIGEKVGLCESGKYLATAADQGKSVFLYENDGGVYKLMRVFQDFELKVIGLKIDSNTKRIDFQFKCPSSGILISEQFGLD